ncbi:MAG: oligosaccharide flippase family protein [Chloroflexota bacterium]
MVAGTGAAQAFLMASGIMAARLLGAEARGHLALLLLVPLVLGAVGGLGVPQAVTFWHARYPSDGPAIIRAAAPAYAVQAVVVAVASVVIAIPLLRPAPQDVVITSLILLVAAPAVLTWQYGVAIAQGRQQFRLAVALLLAAPGGYVAGLVGLALLHSGRLLTVAAVWTLAYALAAALGMAAATRGAGARPGSASEISLRAMLGFGMRALPTLSSPLQTLRLDQAAVGLLLGAAALGHYVVALAFTGVPILLATFMSVTVSGRVAAHRSRRAASRSLAAMVAALAAVAVAVAVGLAVVAPTLVESFFGREFAPAATAARILLFGSVGAAVQRVIGDGLRAIGDPLGGTLGEIGSWTIVVPAVLVGASRSGIDGVAVAVTVSYFTGLAIVVARWIIVSRRQRRVENVEDAIDSDLRASAAAVMINSNE